MDVSRRLLLRTIGSGTVGLGTGAFSNPVSANAKEGEATPEFSLSYPTEVSDTFLNVSAASPYLMGTAGWNDVSIEEKIRTIRRLHAEKLDLHRDFMGSEGPPTRVMSGVTVEQGQFAEDIALPAAGQQHLNINLDPFGLWYEKLPGSKRWTGPNDTEITGPEDLAARRFNGEMKVNKYGGAVPTLYCTRYRDLMADAAITHLAHGYSQVYLDNAIMPLWQGLDFSEWAQHAFRTHLQSLPSDRLDQLGISDPETFDIKAHLEEHGLGPDQVDTPFSDPVAREYKRFQMRTHREYMKAYRDRIHAAFPERSANDGIVVVGNLGLDKLDPPSILLADAFDEVYGESQQTVPSEQVIDRSYKLGAAAGRFDRSVVSVGSMLAGGEFATSTASEFDPSKQYPTLQNLQLGEGFANGGMRSVSLAGWGMDTDQAVDNWITPDGTVPDQLQSVLDFAWTAKPFLTDTEPAHDIAVIYSLPTATLQRAPLWDSRIPAHSRAMDGIATLLRRQQRPYDILIFGLPNVWEDTDQLERLSSYQTVILPDVNAVSDAQVDAIRRLLDAGTHVIATGGVATRDTDRQPRSDFQRLLQEHEFATVYDSTPGRTVTDGATPATDLATPLNETAHQIEVDVDGVMPTIRTQPETNRTIIHLVNYKYDRTTDTVPTHTDVSLSVALPETDLQAARWLTPAGTTDLDISQQNTHYRVTLPRLEVWGVLVLAPDRSGVTHGEESSAQAALTKATDAIRTAKAEDRTHLGLVRSETEVENAQIAFDRGAYSAASRAAERATKQANAAVAPPAIGIDQAHGQSTGEYTWNTFEPLRTRFDRYRYPRLTEWSHESLSELDLLVVPPRTEGAYGFTDTELDRIDDFIEAGGKVVVLGNNAVVEDVSRLLERYDLGFDGAPIIQTEPVFGQVAAEGINPRQFDARGVPSRLTQFAISFRSVNATPVLTSSGSVAELAVVHEESGAYVNRSGAIEEQGAKDESAEGLPIIAASKHGDGYLAAIGTAENFVDPTMSPFGGRNGKLDDPLVASILQTSVTGELTPQPTRTSSTTSVNTTTRATTTLTTGQTETSASSPGFGLASMLGGLGGVTALLRWLHDSSADD